MVTNIKKHLQDRGVDLSKTPVILDEANNYACFLFFNLSGQLIGYQNYNPNADKTYNQGCSEAKHLEHEHMFQKMRYFTYNTKLNGKVNELAVWGLHTYNFYSKFIFMTEGVFDIIKIHNQNLPGLAIMSNDPKSLKGWLRMLPQKKIVIYDDDKGGRRLRKYGDASYTVPAPFHDLGDMTDYEVLNFLKCIGYK